MRTHKHILAKPLCKCKLALFLSILYCLAGLNASSLRKVGMNPSINPIIKMILLLLCNFEKKKKKKKQKERHINMILSHNTARKWSKTYGSTHNYQKSFASEQNVSHKLWPGTSGSPHTYFVQFTLWQQNPVCITIFVRFTALCPLCLQRPKFLATLHEHIQAFDPFSSSWVVACLEHGAGVIVLHTAGEQKL